MGRRPRRQRRARRPGRQKWPRQQGILAGRPVQPIGSLVARVVSVITIRVITRNYVRFYQKTRNYDLNLRVIT
jgi:hypothetical protein